MIGAGRLRGVYAITPANWGEARLLRACETVLAAGVALLQLRDKPVQRSGLARELHALCQRYGTPLIINDDLTLAAQLGCGVHIGGSDAAVSDARRVLGPSAIVGASVYNSVDGAQAALTSGASYVSFGRFFGSTTKPDAPQADLATLHAARARFEAPISAIGGITPDNGGQLVRAGADMLCAVASVFDAPDPAAAVRALRACFIADDAPVHYAP